MKPISRDDARALGLVRYYTGAPCRHGHDAEQYVSYGVCVECNRIRCHANTKGAVSQRHEDYVWRHRMPEAT